MVTFLTCRGNWVRAGFMQYRMSLELPYPMNPNPQRKSVWKLLLITIRYTIVIVGSTCAVFISGALSSYLAEQVRGNIATDVGVPVYEYPDRAVALWLIVFPLLSYVFLFLIKQTLCKNNNLPYWIGGLMSIPCSIIYLYFLSW